MAPGGVLSSFSRNRRRIFAKVYIEGKLQTRKWQDKDGNDRYTTEVVANEMQMLDSRGGSAGYSQDEPPMSQAQEPMPAGDFDDDIPF